ncbi:MAG: hypothetical protein JST54_27610 [Deltaproteobacteria bacterium]|nr:hypothetical protein [Deltaproteobacteria bacterium]
MPADAKPRYVRAALLNGVNLSALGAAGVASVALMNPLPVLLALGAELVYLGTVPALPVFKRSVERRLAQQRTVEATALADAMLAELSPSQREHFYVLRELKDRILANYKRLGSSRILVSSSEQRIDQLLASFLRLLSTLNAYRQYLGQSNRADVERELAELVSDLEREPGPEKVREVQLKRAEILRKRLKRFDQAAEHRELMSHQLASIEDMLRLLHEQSIGMRDPEVVDRQLETIAAEVETTESTVRELQEFLSFDEPAALPTQARERVR